MYITNNYLHTYIQIHFKFTNTRTYIMYITYNTFYTVYILVRTKCVRTHGFRARADVVATKLGIIGANVVRAHARFPCEGRRSGHRGGCFITASLYSPGFALSDRRM